MLVYGSYIYWSNTGTADIGRANLDGTGVNTAFIASAGQAFDLATDGTYLYWNNGRNRIGRATLAGSDAPASYSQADAEQILLLLGAPESDIGARATTARIRPRSTTGTS